MRATKVYKDGREQEVIVRFHEDDRDTLKKVMALPIIVKNSEIITLGQISKVKYNMGPGRILRKNKHRMMHISARLEGISLEKAIQGVSPLLKQIDLPKGYFYLFDDRYYKAVEGRNQLIAAGVLTILLIYMLLSALFESYTLPIIIMTSIPLAVLGVVLMCLLLSKDVQIGTLIGFILLCGVVVNTGIVLVDTMNILRKKGISLVNSIIYSCKMRFRPVLVTTITTVLGLFPMSFESGASAGLWSNLALTVISGISISFFLTLFIVPCFYLILNIRGKKSIMQMLRNK